jgi:hypothetical protein
MNKLVILIFLTAGWPATAGEISNYYYRHIQDNTNWVQTLGASSQKSRSHQQVESTNHGIVELGIERSGSVWGGPTYTFIAKSDGTCHYKGERDVKRTGEYSGTIPIWQFHDLAKFIRDSGYMGFEDEYSRGVTDCPTTYTSVLLNGKHKVVRNYANAGPTTLWAIEQLIDDLMAKAEWKSGLPKAPEPVLPKATRYDTDPVLQLAYVEFFRKGYSDAWEQRESLPVASPTSEVDKARTLGYADGMVAGRAALAKWHGTNSQQAAPAKQ